MLENNLGNISSGELLLGSEIGEDGTTSFTSLTGEKVCNHGNCVECCG